ncbi:hypothetical protein IV49_GL000921 [Kandleria vitulina DSM 20405]|jgi:DeoR/GlpR family transcriptional regulator of sugar metabolism|uniref:HTH deoR-type domain-containing protein n=1 Tax=Kandleria vitulina DSM 20405 TaxID=1410657 RepID=A0A0R2H9X2_9FIRM|nr:DeoR/GlpR family DNA-binding transcription regulator [Kandleria vitulina]KRN49679.1 hypothetical protein IV49_GL000921 [Kandleria vitulina DSM 20405]SEI56870.1 transcriptional regulator, DeoR family [Kandleria vitulina]
MYQKERIHLIYSTLKMKQFLSSQEIMSLCNTSRDTARRDMILMEEEGYASRDRGGITLNQKDKMILDYKERQNENISIKKKLAKHALSYINLQKVIFFDVSTTIYELCNIVPSHIEAYTNAIRNIEALGQRCHAHMIGGTFHPKNAYMYGSETIHEIEQISFDIAFLGAASVKDDGIYFSEQEDALVKKKVAKRSNSVCVIFDDSKYQKKGAFKALDFSEIHFLITNKKPPKHLVNQIREAGCIVDIIGE